jgi:hypothetical protein
MNQADRFQESKRVNPSSPNSPTFIQSQPSMGDQDTMKYSDAHQLLNKLQIARVLHIKSCKTSLYGLQLEVQIRKGNATKLEVKWMAQEECEDMDGYADVFQAYLKNERQMCRE